MSGDCAYPDTQVWPRISIVTPAYNHGRYIEQTIRSVLLQGYPNLEYIIIDGGSDDETLEIIRRYEPWLSSWVSEPDHGQSHAINKGFERATGEIMGWLNSDDVYEPNALQLVARQFASNPHIELVYGDGWYLDESGEKTHRCAWIGPFDRGRLRYFNFILQPAAFWRRTLWHRTGPLGISYRYAMDWEWLIRASKLTEPHYLREDLAGWRITPDIKTRAGGRARRGEIAEISRRHAGVFNPTYLAYLLDRLDWWFSDRHAFNSLGRTVQVLTAPLRKVIKDRLRGRYLS